MCVCRIFCNAVNQGKTNDSRLSIKLNLCSFEPFLPQNDRRETIVRESTDYRAQQKGETKKLVGFVGFGFGNYFVYDQVEYRFIA